MIRSIACFCLFVLLASPAHAETYAEPTWPNLVRTMVRLNTFDVMDDALIDEYAIITDCDLYHSSYADDFKWNQIRASIRDAIQRIAELFRWPTATRQRPP